MADYGHQIEFGYFLSRTPATRRGPGDGEPGRRARLRPARRPGPPLPARPPRHARAARRDPRAHGAGPRLPGRRQPAAAPTRGFAKAAATLDLLSGGRFEAGLGAGGYLRRMRGGFKWAGLGLALLHFGLPFLLLLSADVKKHARALAAVALLVLVMRGVDVIWLIAPEFRGAGPARTFGVVMDLAALVAVGGLWIWLFLGHLASRPILPSMTRTGKSRRRNREPRRRNRRLREERRADARRRAVRGLADRRHPRVAAPDAGSARDARRRRASHSAEELIRAACRRRRAAAAGSRVAGRAGEPLSAPGSGPRDGGAATGAARQVEPRSHPDRGGEETPRRARAARRGRAPDEGSAP